MTGWRLSNVCRQSVVLSAMIIVAMTVGFSALAAESAATTVSPQKKKTFEQAMQELLAKQPKKDAVGADKDRVSTGPENSITVSEIDNFRLKIDQCFEVGFLAADPQADELYAQLSFQLAKDGAVIGTPVIEDTGPGNSKHLAIIARKAIMQCAPYEMLPKDRYEAWSDVVARFSVAGMQ